MWMPPLAVKYAFFAALSTGANLVAQMTVLRLYAGAYNLQLGILSGTAVGIAVKYFLDKRYIFYYRTRTRAHDVLTFALYVLMGGITTVIFWGFELAFNSLFAFEQSKYVGALVGLAIGYTAKYFLDRRFVFTAGRSTA
jgi:putative flippase GtrA